MQIKAPRAQDLGQETDGEYCRYGQDAGYQSREMTLTPTETQAFGMGV